jgi:hypothetical protein
MFMFTLERFRNPAPEYGIHPFWFWNGDMEDQEIVHQIEEMADKGVGGFFICPRQGLKVPYLSDEWFKKCRVAVEAAKKSGMEVWLYDEYPYPSGIAGGEVTLAHPEAKHYTLVHEIEQVGGGQTCTLEMPWARLLYAKAVPVEAETGKRLWERAQNISQYVGNYQAEPIFQKAGLTAYNQKRFFTYRTVKKLHWTAPASEGQWEIHCFLEKEIEDFKYYGTFVDPCNEEAMRTFIELTHERYAQEIGEYFGNTVKGMFTDEIGLLGKVPWSPRIPKYFRERNGYDLIENLHALLYSDELTAQIRYDYYQTINELLIKAYHKPVHDWCEKHGLKYVAEVPSVRMTTQLYSHVPGGDSAHEKLGRSLEWILERYAYGFRYNPKMVSSIGNQLARERALIECFHSVGWSMTLQDAKWMIDRMAAMGINFYNFHAFFYTLDGITQHDAPPSQFLQNPYWQHFRHLGDYVKRISYIMSIGKPVRPIAVLDSTTSFWTHMGNPFHGFPYGGIDESEKSKLERLKQDWFAICKALTLNQKDYDHLDPEILARAEIKDGRILIGNAEYTVLILPPLTNLESEAWKKVREFLAQGGTVIANGLLPYESIDGSDMAERKVMEYFGLERPTSADYWEQGAESHNAQGWIKGPGNAYFVPHAGEDLLALLESLQPSGIRLQAEEHKSFLMQQRRLQNESSFVFISNQEEGEHDAALLVDEGNRPIQAYRLNVETGDIEAIQVERTEEGWSIPLHFAPYQSHLIQLKEADGQEQAVSTESPMLLEVNAGEVWEFHAESDNVLRLDTFELTLDTESGSDSKGTKVPVKTFIDQCEDIAGEQKLPLKFRQAFGTPMKMHTAYPLRCKYETHFEVARIPEVCYLLKDRGAISGDYTIYINGSAVKEDQFESKFVYDHENQIVDIQSLLRKGSNTLTIEMTIEHDWDGVVDALYICGDFGLEFDGEQVPVLSATPKHSTLHGGPYEGYPFYAGTFSFKRNIELAAAPESKEFTLRFENWDANFHDCAEVLVNGHSLGVRPWTPYEWTGSADILQDGSNVIEVKVTNTLIGMLEGKYFDYESHTLKEVSEKKWE